MSTFSASSFFVSWVPGSRPTLQISVSVKQLEWCQVRIFKLNWSKFLITPKENGSIRFMEYIERIWRPQNDVSKLSIQWLSKKGLSSNWLLARQKNVLIPVKLIDGQNVRMLPDKSTKKKKISSKQLCTGQNLMMPEKTSKKEKSRSIYPWAKSSDAWQKLEKKSRQIDQCTEVIWVLVKKLYSSRYKG